MWCFASCLPSQLLLLYSLQSTNSGVSREPAGTFISFFLLPLKRSILKTWSSIGTEWNESNNSWENSPWHCLFNSQTLSTYCVPVSGVTTVVPALQNRLSVEVAKKTRQEWLDQWEKSVKTVVRPNRWSVSITRITHIACLTGITRITRITQERRKARMVLRGRKL